jgi:hypothetical protein
MPKHVTTRSWSDQDVAKLRRFVESGISAARAASHLKRGILSVRRKANSEGCPFPSTREVKKLRVEKELATRKEIGLPPLDDQF